MSTKIPAADLLPRRAALGQMALGFGGLALSTLLSEQSRGAAQLRPQTLFPARARRVIFLFMHGGPSHVDLFDYKPELQKLHGQAVPEEVVAGKRFSTMTGNPQGKLLLAPVEPFQQRGQSGAWVSDFLPYTAQICLLYTSDAADE